MKKVQIQKKDLKLNDFSKLAIDASQQKQIKGGDDTTTVPSSDDIIITEDTNL